MRSSNDTVMIVAPTQWEAGLSASYRRAFELHGFRVSCFDLEAKRREVAPLGRVGYRLMNHLDFYAINTQANRAMVAAAMRERPALVVVFCNEEIRPSALMQLKISVPEAKIVNVFPDPIVGMKSSVVQCLPLYDLFCTHTRAAVPLLAQVGCRAPFYLPLAADPWLHKPEELSDADRREFGCDVAYTGNWRPEHEELFDRLRDYDLAIWGAKTWETKTKPHGWVKTRWRGRPLLTGSEYSKAHRAAKIALNPIDPMNGPSHNQRVFELPACGVFSLVSRRDEVIELFREGESVACFDGADELLAKIRYYMARPEERRRIAENAYKHVVEGGHTYRDRVKTMLDQLGLRSPNG